MARAIHCDLPGKCGFEQNERWNDHVPKSVLENDDYKLLWEFIVRTDHEIGPDFVIINKGDKTCQFINVSILEDGRVREKEDEKVEKPRPSERSSKNVGFEDKGYFRGNGSIDPDHGPACSRKWRQVEFG